MVPDARAAVKYLEDLYLKFSLAEPNVIALTPKEDAAVEKHFCWSNEEGYGFKLNISTTCSPAPSTIILCSSKINSFFEGPL